MLTSWPALQDGTKNQFVPAHLEVQKAAPQTNGRVQWMTIITIGMIAILLFLIAFLIESSQRKPTGLELLALEERRKIARARSDSSLRRTAVQIGSQVIKATSTVRPQVKAMSRSLLGIAAKHGVVVARINGFAKSVISRISMPATGA